MLRRLRHISTKQLLKHSPLKRLQIRVPLEKCADNDGRIWVCANRIVRKYGIPR